MSNEKYDKILNYILLFILICLGAVKLYDFHVDRRVDKLCSLINFNFNHANIVKVEKVIKGTKRSSLNEKYINDEDQINKIKKYICSLKFSKSKIKSKIKKEENSNNQMIFCISFVNSEDKSSNNNQLILEVFPNKVITQGCVETEVYYSYEKFLDKNFLWNFYDSID